MTGALSHLQYHDWGETLEQGTVPPTAPRAPSRAQILSMGHHSWPHVTSLIHLLIYYCLLPHRLETQNKESLLKRYFYPFTMRRRIQFCASPFPCCDWMFPSERGTQCAPPFFPPVELICIVQTHITKVSPVHFSLSKTQPEDLWQYSKRIKIKCDGKTL